MAMNLCYYQQDQKQKNHHKITRRYVTQSYDAKEARDAQDPEQGRHNRQSMDRDN
jgi:hypothetical protein